GEDELSAPLVPVEALEMVELELFLVLLHQAAHEPIGLAEKILDFLVGPRIHGQPEKESVKAVPTLPAELVQGHDLDRLAVAGAAERLERVDEGLHVDAHAAGPFLGARVRVVARDLSPERLAVEEGAQLIEL